MDKATNDEIDLIQLLRGIVLSIKRNVLLIIITIVVAVAISVGLYSSSARVYQSEMIIFSDVMTDSYVEKMSDNLIRMVKARNTDAVAKALNVTKTEAEQLLKVESETKSQKSEPLSADEKIVKKLFVTIRVEITSNDILPSIEKGIVHYLGDNEYLRIGAEQQKKFYTEMIAKVGEELDKMEVLKEKIGQGKFNTSSGMFLMDTSNPFSTSVELFKQRLQYQQLSEVVMPAQVVEGFVPYANPMRPNFIKYVLIGLGIGIMLAIIIITTRGIISLTNEVE